MASYKTTTYPKKVFKVAAVSENTNAFGLKGIMLVAEDGTTYQVAMSAYGSQPLWQVGETVSVPTNSYKGLVMGEEGGLTFAHLGVEIPQRFPDRNKSGIEKVWGRAPAYIQRQASSEQDGLALKIIRDQYDPGAMNTIPLPWSVELCGPGAAKLTVHAIDDRDPALWDTLVVGHGAILTQAIDDALARAQDEFALITLEAAKRLACEAKSKAADNAEQMREHLLRFRSKLSQSDFRGQLTAAQLLFYNEMDEVASEIGDPHVGIRELTSSRS